jgi:hypothetical protein
MQPFVLIFLTPFVSANFICPFCEAFVSIFTVTEIFELFFYVKNYRVSWDLRLILQDLIPEEILSLKCHRHMGPVQSGYAVMNMYSKLNRVEKKKRSALCVY